MKLTTELKNTTGFILMEIDVSLFFFSQFNIRIICCVSELQLQEKSLHNLTYASLRINTTKLNSVYALTVINIYFSATKKKIFDPISIFFNIYNVSNRAKGLAATRISGA